MFEQDNTSIYLAAAVRNVGSGLALMHGWRVVTDWQSQDQVGARGVPPAHRDLYVAPGDIGFWQGAIRDDDDPDRAVLSGLLDERRRFAVDVMYGDQEGGQRTVTRFGITPHGDDAWLCATSRHWFLDRDDPR